MNKEIANPAPVDRQDLNSRPRPSVDDLFAEYVRLRKDCDSEGIQAFLERNDDDEVLIVRIKMLLAIEDSGMRLVEVS